MMTALKYTAIASAFLLTAGSAAFAQNYNQNPSQSPEYSQSYNNENPGTENQGVNSQGFTGYGNQAYNEGTSQEGYNPGMNQGMNQGMQGSTWNSNRQFNSAAGSGNMNFSEQHAVQELRRYGYDNVQDIRPMQGWSADAMRNGEHVHIILGDNGEVATFRGRR